MHLGHLESTKKYIKKEVKIKVDLENLARLEHSIGKEWDYVLPPLKDEVNCVFTREETDAEYEYRQGLKDEIARKEFLNLQREMNELGKRIAEGRYLLPDSGEYYSNLSVHTLLLRLRNIEKGLMN